jgi:uncharacterized spore protein YtfJ
MDPSPILEKTQADLTAKRVFSDPIERDGSVVVFAASLRGGGGGGHGQGHAFEGKSEGTGGGVGYGLVARPAGAFVLRNGKVRWMPAVDVNRIVLGAQIVTACALLVFRTVVRFRMRSLARRRFMRRLGPPFLYAMLRR